MLAKNGDNYDIIIVGAGPAGCVAAHELANEFDVLLIEKGELPQKKPCGGLLCEESVDILKKWEGVDDILTSPPFVTLGYIDFDNNTTIKTERQFWNTDRKKFSSWLLNRLPPKVTILSHAALENLNIVGDGIEIVVKHRKNLNLKTKYLIGADGTASSVRRAISDISTKRSTLYQVFVNEQFFMVYFRQINHKALFMGDTKGKPYNCWNHT